MKLGHGLLQPPFDPTLVHLHPVEDELLTEILGGDLAARYIKITIKDNWGNKLKQYSLSEVRFFSIPVAARRASQRYDD
jgi:hypothetical protein